MVKPVEILLFDFLAAAIAAAVPGDVIYELDLHDTVYQTIDAKQGRGIRISEAAGSLAPGPGGGLKECDVELIIVCYSRVTGREKTDRQPALIDVFATQQEVAKAIYEDPTLGGRVCDVIVGKGSRGYDVIDGEPYAAANVPILINPTGTMNRN